MLIYCWNPHTGARCIADVLSSEAAMAAGTARVGDVNIGDGEFDVGTIDLTFEAQFEFILSEFRDACVDFGESRRQMPLVVEGEEEGRLDKFGALIQDFVKTKQPNIDLFMKLSE